MNVGFREAGSIEKVSRRLEKCRGRLFGRRRFLVSVENGARCLGRKGSCRNGCVLLCSRKRAPFGEPHNYDTDPNIVLRFVKNIWRNVRATGPWFLLGIALSAVFQRYVPGEAIGKLFGENEGFGILLAAGAGVPLYVCGGGTIPLLLEWLSNGMSYGSAAAFMLTGPATKITNLGALKTVLGFRNFAIYLAFLVLFSLFVGGVANWVLF